MKTWPKGDVAVVTWPTLKFWAPANISAMAEDTVLKFCMRIDGKGYWTKKNENVLKMGRGRGHVT